MADNVFRNIGTAITRPIGELFGGAVTALQPGRVQQMQFERQQQELKNHFDMFNRFLTMGDKPSAYKYMTDTILPFVKASPELIESVQQFQPGLAKPTTVGEARMMGAEKHPVGSPEWDRYIGISQRKDASDLWQQWQKNKQVIGVEDLSDSEKLILEQKNKDLMQQIQGAEGYRIKEEKTPGKESWLPFGWGDTEARTEYGLEKISPTTGEPTPREGGVFGGLARPSKTGALGQAIEPTAPREMGLGGKLQPSPFAGISTPEMRGDILSGGVQGWPTIPQEEINVFEQLTPKKTVKQLQKQKSRDPTALELSQIFANAKVPRTEIDQEAAKLKSIWNELELEEKIEAYALMAEGYKAKEIIDWFRKESKENEQ